MMIRIVMLCAVVLAATPAAEADCAGPRTFTAPKSGSAIPATGEVIVFAPRYVNIGPVVVKGATFSAQQMSVDPKSALTAVRINIKQAAGKKVQLFARGEKVSEFTIDPKWKKRGRLTLGKDKRIVDQWSCSHTNTHEFAVEGKTRPIAYEVAYAGGKVGAVIPAEPVRAFGDNTRTNNALVIGHVSCLGDTVRRQAGARATFTAIFADGSRQQLGTRSIK